MSLEKDISQSRFGNEFQKSVINILFTAGWISEQIKEKLEPYGITQQQYNILRILRGSGAPLSTRQIRDRMLDRMSDTSRIVDRLVIKNLVQKIVCFKDKRMVDITITDSGRELLKTIDAIQQDLDGILKNIGEDEARQLNQLLDKIRKAS
jgi:DNA-binding MarR family transcriptional regulator